MTHREVLEALSGLLLAMFVAMLSSTVVTNALPRIVTDLNGSQTGYTWVVVATLLTMTASTPIWGKLADLFSKKLLVQSALVIYGIGSLIAGLAPSMEVLIGARAVQGLGVGGLTALVQVVIASMVSPRERGRYSGYIGATFALATVSGPLIGGLIVDAPGLGWRWCFFLGLPVAALAFLVLQKTLHLPVDAARCRSTTSARPCSCPGSRCCWSGCPWPGSRSRGPLSPASPSWWSGAGRGRGPVRRGPGRRRAGGPAAAVPGPHHLPGHRRLGAGRSRDVRLDGLPQPVLPAVPRDEAHQGRPDVGRHGRRPAGLEHRQRPDDHPHRPVEAVPGHRDGHGRGRTLTARGHRRGTPSLWSAPAWPCWGSGWA